MSTFSTLTCAIKKGIGQFCPTQSAGVSIVIEDDKNMPTEIAKAQAQIGMLVFIGTPHFQNESPLAKLVNAKLTVAVLVREVPTIWRRSANTNPIHGTDLGQAIGGGLQGACITGFQPLRVMTGTPLGKLLADPATETSPWNDYVILIETMQIFNLSGGS